MKTIHFLPPFAAAVFLSLPMSVSSAPIVLKEIFGTKGGDRPLVATAPDMCWTPDGGASVPMPFPNIIVDTPPIDDHKLPSVTLKYGAKKPLSTNDSTLPSTLSFSIGNEAGYVSFDVNIRAGGMLISADRKTAGDETIFSFDLSNVDLDIFEVLLSFNVDDVDLVSDNLFTITRVEASNVEFIAVNEPSGLALLGSGLVTFGWFRSRRIKSRRLRRNSP